MTFNYAEWAHTFAIQRAASQLVDEGQADECHQMTLVGDYLESGTSIHWGTKGRVPQSLGWGRRWRCPQKWNDLELQVNKYDILRATKCLFFEPKCTKIVGGLGSRRTPLGTNASRAPHSAHSLSHCWIQIAATAQSLHTPGRIRAAQLSRSSKTPTCR